MLPTPQQHLTYRDQTSPIGMIVRCIMKLRDLHSARFIRWKKANTVYADNEPFAVLEGRQRRKSHGPTFCDPKRLARVAQNRSKSCLLCNVMLRIGC